MDKLLAENEMNAPPLISICIPTFNRANHLSGLLKNISSVISGFDKETEICISNNASTDSTSEVIGFFASTMKLNTITQASNIGATLNAIEVTKLATGRWLVIVGDDDEFYSDGFRRLLLSLNKSDDDEWFLVGVTDSKGSNNLLKNLDTRTYSSKEFRLELIKKGLFPFGFIGMHVFPRALKNVLQELKPDQCRPWPHLALLFRYLDVGRFRVHPSPVIAQAKGGEALFWNIGDWVIANASKLHILSNSVSQTSGLKLFLYAIALREIYSIKSIQELVLWKLLEPKDFRLRAFPTYAACYRLLGPTIILAGLHAFTLTMLIFLPYSALLKVIDVMGKRHIILRYKKDKKNKIELNGIKRGL